MDLLDWVGTLLRRWWLTVPLLLAALAGSGAIALVTPWKYEAKATAVLLSSPVQAKQAGGNPWLVFDSSLTVTAEVVGREMMDPRTAAAIRAKGGTAGYVVGVAPDSTGPVLAIEASGSDAAGTKATLDALLAVVPERLARLQAQESVAPHAQIRMNVISATPQATRVSTDKIRLVVMTLFLGLAVTVAVPLFAEVLSERRRRGREGGRAGAPPPDRTEPPNTAASAGPHRLETPKPSTREAAPPPARRGALPRRMGTVSRADTSDAPDTSDTAGPEEPAPDAPEAVEARGKPRSRASDTPDTYGLLDSQAPRTNGTRPQWGSEPAEMSEPDA
ncbi:hypothetical protein [Actinomadura sp. NEAU-AAG7]|uniref:hypothetical protein n=1 Tax=Actinomadura sp. NEAU-AAG7 TaxID=2839640 RepID=UPI001BE48138|nr:hypothetical protein [Actinomadura sp. NEAU-AAG7]MBT2209009.1 hypothetical protein [Actinomadura sp. NEAU-AAG7]